MCDECFIWLKWNVSRTGRGRFRTYDPHHHQQDLDLVRNHNECMQWCSRLRSIDDNKSFRVTNCGCRSIQTNLLSSEQPKDKRSENSSILLPIYPHCDKDEANRLLYPSSVSTAFRHLLVPKPHCALPILIPKAVVRRSGSDWNLELGDRWNEMRSFEELPADWDLIFDIRSMVLRHLLLLRARQQKLVIKFQCHQIFMS